MDQQSVYYRPHTTQLFNKNLLTFIEKEYNKMMKDIIDKIDINIIVKDIVIDIINNSIN